MKCRRAASSSKPSVTGNGWMAATSAACAAQPDEILLRRHQRQRGFARFFDQLVDLSRGERMMIGERARRGDVDAACGQRCEKPLRVADACEGQHALAAQRRNGITIRNDPRLQDETAARLHALRKLAGSRAVAGDDENIRAVHLPAERRAQRPRRKHAGRCRCRDGCRPRSARYPFAATDFESRRP